MAVLEYKKLDVWNDSMDFVAKVYEMFPLFPQEEKFGIVAQMRRASVSIPSNIAEGCSRQSKKEAIKFIYISLGSLSEVETQLMLSEKLGFVKLTQECLEEIEKLRRQMYGLIRFLSKPQPVPNPKIQKSENPKILHL